MGPAPGLGAHAHCAADGAQARAKHQGREWAAPQTRANALNIPPYNGQADSESTTAPDGGRKSGTWLSDTHQGRRRHARDPQDAKMTPAASP